MRRTYCILMIAVFVWLTCACNKTEHCPITALDRQMIPYQMGDSVRFLDKRGNIVTITATKESSRWYPLEYLMEEHRTVHLKSEDSAYILTLEVQGWYFGSYPKPLSIVFSSPFGNSWSSLLYNTGGSFRKNEDVYDSLTIGNHIYYNVAFHHHSQYSDDYPQYNGTWTIYYNKTYGVLQMTLDEKPVFTLDTVIFADKK